MADLSLRALSSLRRLAARASLEAWTLASSLGVRFSRERLQLSPRLRLAVIATAVACVALVLAGGALWWRLASGPLSVDLVTPWMISALEEHFGGKYSIEVGGTVLERDEDGRTALRLRDILMRDRHGVIVASAPRAEVGIATSSLFSGHPRVERLSLIGAHMAVRIERNGAVTVFAGGTEPPPAESTKTEAGTTEEAAANAPLPPATDAAGAPDGATRLPPDSNLFATLVGWLQTLDSGGLDGQDLVEIGLKNGSIAVDDRRNGRHLTFGNINLGLTRLPQGGVALAVTSIGTDGPWSLNATVTKRADKGRSVEAVVRDISPKDILLALRLDDGLMQADMPLSGLVRADFAADGTLSAVQGRLLAGAGYIGDRADEAARILIDEAQMELHWDPASRSFNIPIDIQAGTSRLAAVAHVVPPGDADGVWSFSISKGMLALASGERGQGAPPLVLDHIGVNASYDPGKHRFEIARADLRGAATGIAFSGAIDGSQADPRLTVGLAGGRMPVSAFKRLWPAVIAPELRNWVEQHFLSGLVERVEIAANLPLSVILPTGPSIPKDGLSIEVAVRGATVRPVDGLPPVKDVQVVTRVSGRIAHVSFEGGRMEVPKGGMVAVGPGTFEVADTAQRPPRAQAKVELSGPVEAAAALMDMEPIRGVATLPFDASSSKGDIAARLSLALPLVAALPRGSVTYAVEADVTGFSAENLIRGQKAEAGNLHVNASTDALQIKGDLRIAGMPASIEYRKARGEPDAEVRLQATLDDAARSKLGLDFGSELTGPIPVKLSGRMKVGEQEGRLSVEADLTQTRVSELLPGWQKPPGRTARASFTLIERGQSERLEDFVLDGAGVNVKGTVVLGPHGEIQQASLPVFAVSDGDKASLKAERTNDGTLKVTLRGDVYDGRGLVKAALSGQKPESGGDRSRDIDLDIKLGAITGHHGEALRKFELRMSRRGGTIRSFNLSGGLGANARVVGEMRSRGNGQRVLYIETTDAGALFRFSDTYPRIFGGTMSVAIEPPTNDNNPQEGLLNIRDFVVRGEPALERIAAGALADDRQPRSRSTGVAFSRMRVEFTRTLGRFTVRDGVVWGPTVGATVDGTLDYARDEVRLRGTFVPAYGLNNMFSRLPIVGMFLGGGANEGLLGVTYQVVGSPRAPVLRVNPMSAIAPGFLRKLFEFRGGEDRGALRAGEPTR